MDFTQDVLFILLIGVIAQATDTDLATKAIAKYSYLLPNQCPLLAQ